MSENDAPKGRSFALKPRTVLAGLVSVVLLLFWSANRNQVKVSFLVFDSTVRVWVALLVASLFGLALGLLLGRRRR